MALDRVEVDPKHYQLEFENDQVRVLPIRFAPHERSVMHGHLPCIVVILSDCDFRFNFPHGKKQDILGKAGQIISFEEPFEHLPENLSDKRFEAILVELKA
jgi:hypothetical protein